MARGSVYSKINAAGRIVWYTRVELPREGDGKRRSHSEQCPPTITTRKAATDLALRRQIEMDNANHVDLSRLTLTAYIAEYLQRRVIHQKGNLNSIRKYASQGKIISAHLGARRIGKITPTEIQHFLDTLLRAGRTVNTVAQYGQFLRMLFASAVKAGHILHNPMARVEVPTGTPRPQDVLTGQQAAQLLAVARQDSCWPVWAFFLGTGLRIGEVLAVRWSDLDLAKQRLFVRRAWKRVGGDSTKTPAGVRIVALPTTLVVELSLHAQRIAERARAEPAWQDHDLVFPGRFGGTISDTAIRDRLAILCRQAAVPAVTPHDLRRTYATLAAEAGANPRSIADSMGHADMTETLRTYTHTTEGMRDGIADTLEALLRPAVRQSVRQPPPPGGILPEDQGVP